MNNIPMSEETKAKLLKSIEDSIENSSKALEEVRNYIEKINLMKKFLADHNINVRDKIFDSLERMLEYRMLIGILFLDLASATRAHLNSKYSYEKLFSTRKIIVIINEGYKQIYNFVQVNDNGESIAKNRNKSFWINDIGAIINSSLPELKGDYDSITIKLDRYYDENFSTLKPNRDLSIHYDKNASKVYDMSVNLDIDDIFRKMIPFVAILSDMFLFTEKMARISYINEQKKTIQINESLMSNIVDLEVRLKNARTNVNNDTIQKLLDFVEKIKNDAINKSPNT
jgi:hypothetical protein